MNFLIKLNHKCMHIHLRPNIPKYKRRGKVHLHEKLNFVKKKIVYNYIRQLFCCDITDIRRVPPERATYTKLRKPLKIISFDWIIQIILSKLLMLCFLNHTLFTQSA